MLIGGFAILRKFVAKFPILGGAVGFLDGYNYMVISSVIWDLRPLESLSKNNPIPLLLNTTIPWSQWNVEIPDIKKKKTWFR